MTSRVYIKQEKSDNDDSGAVEAKQPKLQSIYVALDYPHKEHLGIGTCGIFSGPSVIQAFRRFNQHVEQHVVEHCRRTEKRIGNPVCPRPIVTEVFRFEHAFVVHDEDSKLGRLQADDIERRCFVSDFDDHMPVWLATNYVHDISPWRNMIFCAAPSFERAKILVYEELESLAAEDNRVLKDLVTFDLYKQRTDCNGKYVMHLTNVDKPLVPTELFEFVGSIKMGDPSLRLKGPLEVQNVTVAPPTEIVTEDSSNAHIGVKRKNRGSATASDNALKRANATLSSADVASVHGSLPSALDTTPAPMVQQTEPENTEALLAEMHEFLKSDEKELVPTKKSHHHRKSSSKTSSGSAASSYSSKALESEKKQE